MSHNYSLNTPVKREVYVPCNFDLPFKTVIEPMKNSETDQTHRNLQWLFHKPQNHAILPFQPQAVKIEKKK